MILSFKNNKISRRTRTIVWMIHSQEKRNKKQKTKQALRERPKQVTRCSADVLLGDVETAPPLPRATRPGHPLRPDTPLSPPQGTLRLPSLLFSFPSHFSKAGSRPATSLS